MQSIAYEGLNGGDFGHTDCFSRYLAIHATIGLAATLDAKWGIMLETGLD